MQFQFLANLPINNLLQRQNPLFQQSILSFNTLMHIVINCIILLDMFQSLLKSIVGYAFVVYLLEGLLDLLLDSEEFIQICSILNLDG